MGIEGLCNVSDLASGLFALEVGAADHRMVRRGCMSAAKICTQPAILMVVTSLLNLDSVEMKLETFQANGSVLADVSKRLCSGRSMGRERLRIRRVCAICGFITCLGL